MVNLFGFEKVKHTPGVVDKVLGVNIHAPELFTNLLQLFVLGHLFTLHDLPLVKVPQNHKHEVRTVRPKVLTLNPANEQLLKFECVIITKLPGQCTNWNSIVAVHNLTGGEWERVVDLEIEELFLKRGEILINKKV